VLGQAALCGAALTPRSGRRWPLRACAIFDPLLADPPWAGGCWGWGQSRPLPRLRCPSPEGLNFCPGPSPASDPQPSANFALAKLGKTRPLPARGRVADRLRGPGGQRPGARRATNWGARGTQELLGASAAGGGDPSGREAAEMTSMVRAPALPRAARHVLRDAAGSTRAGVRTGGGQQGDHGGSADGGGERVPGAGLTAVGEGREVSARCRVLAGGCARGAARLPEGHRHPGTLAQPRPELGAARRRQGVAESRARGHARRHRRRRRVRPAPPGETRSRRQVPAAAPSPVRGAKETPKIALRARDAKAAHGDCGPCPTQPPRLAGGPDRRPPTAHRPPSQLPGAAAALAWRHGSPQHGGTAHPGTASPSSWAGALRPSGRPVRGAPG